MVIETVYHEFTPNRLVFVADSHVGKGLAEFVENYFYCPKPHGGT